MTPTPYPAIPSFSDGAFVHQGDLNGLGQHVNYLYSGNLGGFLTAPPVCTVRKTSGQSIPNNTDTQVLWDVADINAAGMWTGAAPGVMTVSVPGTYLLYAQLTTDGTPTQLGIRLLVNGLTPAIHSITTFSSAATAGSATGFASLGAGSVISAFCYQSNASPATLQTTFGSCRMAAVLISN